MTHRRVATTCETDFAMNYDIHILLACLVGVIFSVLLLNAAGRKDEKASIRMPEFEKRSDAARQRRAA